MIKALLPQLKFNGGAPLQVPAWLLPSSPLTSSCKLAHLIRKLGEGRAAEVEVEREGEYKLKDRKQERRLKKQHIWECEGRLQSRISSFFWSADIYHKVSLNCSCSSSLGWGSLMSLNIWRPTWSRSKDLLDTLRCGKWLGKNYRFNVNLTWSSAFNHLWLGAIPTMHLNPYSIGFL